MRVSLRLVLAVAIAASPLMAHASPISSTLDSLNSAANSNQDNVTLADDSINQQSLNVVDMAFLSATTPEPNSFVLLGTGLLCGMALLARRQMRQQN